MSVKPPVPALQWGAIGNRQLTQQWCSSFKIAVGLWRSREEEEVWDWEISLSAQEASFEKDSSLLPENGAYANFGFTPTRQVKGHVRLGSLGKN